MQEQQQQLHERFEALSLSQATPTLPEAPSHEAIQALVSHPYLADCDQLYARLLQQCLPAAMSDEQTELIAQCYQELSGRVSAAQEPPEPHPPSRPQTPPQGPPPSYIYVSRSGREYDTRNPPPHPCYRCRTMHWSNTPCPQQSRGYGFYQRNSRGGTSHPAPAPAAGPKRSPSASH